MLVKATEWSLRVFTKELNLDNVRNSLQCKDHTVRIVQRLFQQNF